MFSEKAGTGNGAQYDNSDIRTLNLVKPPFDVKKGNYRVRMEWGSAGWAEFTVSGGLGQGRHVIGLFDINQLLSFKSNAL